MSGLYKFTYENTCGGLGYLYVMKGCGEHTEDLMGDGLPYQILMDIGPPNGRVFGVEFIAVDTDFCEGAVNWLHANVADDQFGTMHLRGETDDAGGLTIIFPGLNDGVSSTLDMLHEWKSYNPSCTQSTQSTKDTH